MKKFILTLLMVFTVGVAFSQVKYFQTTQFSYKYLTEYNYWTDWSDWEKCTAKVKLDLDNDIIVIYTNETQKYYVYEYVGEVEDNSGQTIKFAVIDHEDDYGYVRLRVQNNGTKQIYIDFNNIKWVYNLK